MENRLSISTSEWKGYLSTTYGEFWGLIAESGYRYFETHDEFTADGSASYDEPEDILSLVGVDRVAADGTRYELEELMAQERNLYAGQTGDAHAYMLIDDLLYLRPRPSSGTYDIIYIQQPPDLTGEDDDYLVDVVTPDGEAFLLWGVAVQAFAKEGSDVSVARAEREEARQRVTAWAVMRMLHTPRRNVLGGEPYRRTPGDFPPYGGA